MVPAHCAERLSVFPASKKSVDWAKKLKLISSAARTRERQTLAERALGGRTRSTPSWELLGWGPGQLHDRDEVVAGQSFDKTSRQ
jgi:hypothetical protein